MGSFAHQQHYFAAASENDDFYNHCYCFPTKPISRFPALKSQDFKNIFKNFRLSSYFKYPNK